MKKLKKFKKETMVLFTVSCLFFCFTVSILFSKQNKELKNEFDKLVIDNISTSNHGQKRQIMGIIDDLKNLLTSMSSMIEMSSLSPQTFWLETYLAQLSSENTLYQIDYISIEQLQEESKLYQYAEDIEIYELLMSGKQVVSDIHYSQRLGGDYFFAVAQPVLNDGKVIGILRARMNAAALTIPIQKSSIFQKANTLIIKGDGTILYSDTHYNTTGNLFSSMQLNDIPEETVLTIEHLFQKTGDVTYRFTGKGNIYYISIVEIGINDWHIVKFVRSPDVLIHSEEIFKDVVFTGILLIVFTAIAGGMVGILLLRQKQKLEIEQQRYLTLSEFSDTILFEYNYTTDTLEFTSNAYNGLFLNSLKYKDILKNIKQFELIYPEDRETVKQSFQANMYCKEDRIFHFEIRLKNKENIYSWFNCQYKYVKDHSGNLSRIVGKVVDISEQKEREQSLLEQVQKDTLTDVYNKAGECVIEKLLKENPTGLFFMIDLDNFKEINDTYGHIAGDELLAKVGKTLKNMFRCGDVIARIGGDEFVVFLPCFHDKKMAEEKAQLILEKIREIKLEKVPLISISASIGVSIAPENGKNYFELYSASDKAMYLIKQGKKGGFCIFQQEIN